MSRGSSTFTFVAKEGHPVFAGFGEVGVLFHDVLPQELETGFGWFCLLQIEVVDGANWWWLALFSCGVKIFYLESPEKFLICLTV